MSLLPTSKHYNVRAFHTEDITVPWSMLDMKLWNAYHFSGLTMDDLGNPRSIVGADLRRRFVDEISVASDTYPADISAFPTPGVVDDLNRANETPLSGGGIWAGPIDNSRVALSLSSNKSTMTTGSSGQSYFTGLSTADSDAYCTVTAVPGVGTGTSVAVWGRVQSPNTGSAKAYLIVWTEGTGWRYFKFVAGTGYTQLGATIASPAIVNGDKIGLRILGTTITGYRYHSGTWTALASRTDSSITGAGTFGYEVNDTPIFIDDLAGGIIGDSTYLKMSDLDLMTMKKIDFFVISAGNEEWPTTDIDPAVTVAKNSSYRYANTISVNLADAVPKTVTSNYSDDIFTDFNTTGNAYFIEMVLKAFPAQADPAHLDLANSFIDFSSDNLFTSSVTDSIPFNASLTSLTAGGSVVFRINRNALTKVILTNLRSIRFRLLATGGSMTFIVQAIRIIPNDYTYPVIAIDTKRGVLARAVSQTGAAESGTPYGDIYFDGNRPKNSTTVIKFNSGHNPTGNDNTIRLFYRHDAALDNRLDVRLFARDTQSRLRIYKRVAGVETEIFSTPITSNILVNETDYYMVVELRDNKITASIYQVEGLRLGALVYTTGIQTVTSVLGRGYNGFSFEPYNYDFVIDYLEPNNIEFAIMQTKAFNSLTPVSGATLFTHTSEAIPVLDMDDMFEFGDATVSTESIGRPIPATKITRTGLEWYGGLRNSEARTVGNASQLLITGEIYIPTQVRGLYRVSILNKDDSVAFMDYIQGIRPNQWTSFSIPVISDVLPEQYQLFIHQAGFYADVFYLDNVQVQHNSIGWEASIDGTTWQRFLNSVNGDYTGVLFNPPGTHLQVRATAYADTAWISGYELKPHYMKYGQKH